MIEKDVNPIDGLRQWSRVAPHKFRYAFCAENGDEIDSLNARELSDQLEEIKVKIGALKVIVDDDDDDRASVTQTRLGRILFVYEPGIRWFPVFLACIDVGLIPCVVYPIDPSLPRAILRKRYEFYKVVAKECMAVFCSGKMMLALRLTRILLMDAHGLPCRVCVVEARTSKEVVVSRGDTKSVIIKKCSGQERSAADDERTAFIQYTSGSTGTPKGVIISHRALSANCAAIRKGFKTTPFDSLCSWLPQYHDMGLIGGFFVPLTIATGFKDHEIDVNLLPKTTCVFFSPIAFAKDPTLWIRLMSKYSSTMTQAPDFAFALALRKFVDSNIGLTNDDINLCNLRHVLNASEPVRAQTVSDFYKTFQKYGLKYDALRVGYGLAEVCVYASEHPVEFFKASRELLESSEDTRIGCAAKEGEAFIELACVGINTSHMQYKVFEYDADIEVKEPGIVGRLIVSTNSICSGYANDEKRTCLTFNFERNEVCTGDEGFVLADKRVFILGRCTDRIDLSFAGHSCSRIQSSEFERVGVSGLLCSSNIVRKGSCSAFGIGKHEYSKVVFILEVSDTFLKKSNKVKASELRREIEIQIEDTYAAKFPRGRLEIILTYPRSTPRTTSGKVRRFAVKRKYLGNEIEEVFDDNDDDDDESDDDDFELDEIDSIVFDTVKLYVRGVRKPSYALDGATSVQFLSIANTISKTCNIKNLDTYQILTCKTAKEIATLVKRSRNGFSEDVSHMTNDNNHEMKKKEADEAPYLKRYPSKKFALAFMLLFAAQEILLNNHATIKKFHGQRNKVMVSHDSRNSDFLRIVIPFQLLSVCGWNIFVFSKRGRSFNLRGGVGIFGIASLFASHGLFKSLWLILFVLLVYQAKKTKPLLCNKPAFVWFFAIFCFAIIAALERKNMSPAFALMGHIQTTGSIFYDGILGTSSFHIYRCSRYVVLRCVDYALNSKKDDFASYFSYVFFAPLFQCGPLVAYENFEKQILHVSTKRRKNIKKKRMMSFAKDLFDLLVWAFVQKFLRESNAIALAAKSSSLSLLTQTVSLFASSRCAFGIGRAITRVTLKSTSFGVDDFFDVPIDDTPLFLFDCLKGGFRTLWWNFHASFRDFYVRNVFVPLQGGYFAIFATMFISATFHDVSFSDMRWLLFFLSQSCGLAAERFISQISPSYATNSHENKFVRAVNVALVWSCLVFADGSINLSVTNWFFYSAKLAVFAVFLI